MGFEYNGYIFRYFFDAYVDGYGDVEGYKVYDGEHLIAELWYYSQEEIEAMSSDELEELIDTNLV